MRGCFLAQLLAQAGSTPCALRVVRDLSLSLPPVKCLAETLNRFAATPGQYREEGLVPQTGGARSLRLFHRDAGRSRWLAYHPTVDLKPAEHLWKDPREKAFFNTSFPSMRALEEVLCTAINQPANDPHRLCSLTGFPPVRMTSCNAN